MVTSARPRSGRPLRRGADGWEMRPRGAAARRLRRARRRRRAGASRVPRLRPRRTTRASSRGTATTSPASTSRPAAVGAARRARARTSASTSRSSSATSFGSPARLRARVRRRVGVHVLLRDRSAAPRRIRRARCADRQARRLAPRVLLPAPQVAAGPPFPVSRARDHAAARAHFRIAREFAPIRSARGRQGREWVVARPLSNVC